MSQRHRLGVPRRARRVHQRRHVTAADDRWFKRRAARQLRAARSERLVIRDQLYAGRLEPARLRHRVHVGPRAPQHHHKPERCRALPHERGRDLLERVLVLHHEAAAARVRHNVVHLVERRGGATYRIRTPTQMYRLVRHDPTGGVLRADVNASRLGCGNGSKGAERTGRCWRDMLAKGMGGRRATICDACKEDRGGGRPTFCDACKGDGGGGEAKRLCCCCC
eukprot:363493-Chlamydomonas_euryale.AAC.1